jgi:hypothetical protein
MRDEHAPASAIADPHVRKAKSPLTNFPTSRAALSYHTRNDPHVSSDVDSLLLRDDDLYLPRSTRDAIEVAVSRLEPTVHVNHGPSGVQQSLECLTVPSDARSIPLLLERH